METARKATRNQTATVCPLCKGSCHDPRVPFRHLPKGNVLYIVKPCPNCEGRGALITTSDRDLSRV